MSVQTKQYRWDIKNLMVGGVLLDGVLDPTPSGMDLLTEKLAHFHEQCMVKLFAVIR